MDGLWFWALFFFSSGSLFIVFGNENIWISFDEPVLLIVSEFGNNSFNWNSNGKCSMKIHFECGCDHAPSLSLFFFLLFLFLPSLYLFKVFCAFNCKHIRIFNHCRWSLILINIESHWNPYGPVKSQHHP